MLIIYGAGAEGQRALEDIGRENVFCIVDQKKRGIMDGCPVYSLAELSVPDKDDVLFLITPRRYRHEIADDLRQAGYHHFCLYTHVSGGGTSQALSASQWGELYNQKQLEQVIADVRAQRMKSWSREMLALTKPGDRVLEIGCGSGATTLQLASQGRVCTAIDYSEQSIALVRRAAERLEVSVTAEMTDARKVLPFAEDAFDFVFQAGLLEHFQREERIRLLKLWQPVGHTMISMIPNANSFAYRAGKLLQERSGDWLYGMELPQATMKDEFLAAGYQAVREYTIGVEDALSFLPESHYLRMAMQQWFAEHPQDLFGQGYLLCTIGEKER